MSLLLCADCDGLRRVDQHGRCESCAGMSTARLNPGGEIARLLAIERARPGEAYTPVERGLIVRCLWRWIQARRAAPLRVVRPIPRRAAR